jgi:Spy/CpxP family protein refolding chaperone
MKLSRGAIAAYVALVFACGAVLGAYGHRLYTVSMYTLIPTVSAKSPAKAPPNPEELRKGYISTMQSKLNLSSDQVSKLNLILDDTRARMREVHDKTQPEIHEIRMEQTEKIRALLTPEQRSTYEEMLKRREERLREKGPRNGGPGF